MFLLLQRSPLRIIRIVIFQTTVVCVQNNQPVCRVRNGIPLGRTQPWEPQYPMLITVYIQYG